MGSANEKNTIDEESVVRKSINSEERVYFREEESQISSQIKGVRRDNQEESCSSSK